MDKNDISEKNQALILDALKRLKAASKPSLAKETGLSAVTVNAHLNTLIKKRKVELVEKTRSIGGRPAKIYRINPESKLALGMYITPLGAKFKLTTFIINLFNDVISGTESITEKVTVEFLQEEIKQSLLKFPSCSSIILGLDGETVGGVFYSDTYNALNNLKLKEELSAFASSQGEKTERAVALTKDIDAAIIGAAKLENIDLKESVLVGVSWKGKAISTGILINGNSYLGKDGFAGNMGSAINTNNPIEDAARALSLTTRLINPHQVIFYNPKLRLTDGEAIKKIVLKEIDEKFLPQILIRPDISEDYGEGIYTLVASLLSSNSKITGASEAK